MLVPSDPHPRHRRPQSPPPTPLPHPQQPHWLKTLARWQQLTTVAAMGAIGAALGTYAFTVYQWQAWNQAARQLEELRYQERSLQSASVALEASLAEAAERSPLVLWDPEKTLFLKAPPPDVMPLATEPSPVPLAPLPMSPLAY